MTQVMRTHAPPPTVPLRWNQRITRMLLDGQRVAVWGGGEASRQFIADLDRGRFIPYVIDSDAERCGQTLPTGQTVRPPDALVECGPIAPVRVLVVEHDAFEQAEYTIASLGLNATVLMVE